MSAAPAGASRARKHVLVVGAGVVGLSTAYYAARAGHRVTVFDRAGAGERGCSFGNAGLVVPSHFVPLAAPGMVARGLRYMADRESPFYVRPRLSAELLGWGFRFWRASNAAHVARSAPLLRDLHVASLACFEDWAAAWGDDFGLTRHGLLMLCHTRGGLEEEIHAAEQAHRLGLAAEVLDRAALEALEPGLTMDVAGGVRYPGDCHLDPGRLMAALAHQVQELGVSLQRETEVLGWRRNGERVSAVCTPQGEQTADEFVLCGGAWSSQLARGLGLKVPLQAGKGYSLTLPQPSRLPRHGAILSEARVAVTPMGSALRFGGTLELAGLDRSIDPVRVNGIVRSVLRYYPAFPAEELRVPAWCGLRPCSPDGLPYLGRFRRYANLSAATGHAMMGVSLGPISGKLMAEILSDGPPSLDITPLRPDRYE